VAQTGDPILAAELARLSRPPAPAEAAAHTLDTGALLAKLPGRHDLIGPASSRLCTEFHDHNNATWSFCRKAVESVVSRSVSAAVLLDCHRQATSDKARDRGKVFVAAWKREGRAVD
jgi:hypothetical protein